MHAQAHSIYISIYTYSSIYVLCFPKLYVEIIIEKYTRKRNCLVCILYDLYLFIYFFICSRFLSYIAMKQPWVYMCSPSQSPLYAEQKKRHRFIEQSFRLCRRRRGWDVSREQHWNMYFAWSLLTCWFLGGAICVFLNVLLNARF